MNLLAEVSGWFASTTRAVWYWVARASLSSNDGDVMFRVGMKVVWVGPDLRNNGYDVRYNMTSPEPGVVYIIRNIRPESYFTAVLLHEIKNRDHEFLGSEIAFNAAYFRPVVERKTDISIFKKMLTPQKVM